MKKVPASMIVNTLMNEQLTGLVESVPNMNFVVKLDDLLKERNITMNMLSKITGIRLNTISDFAKGTNVSITKTHLFAIMIALRVTKVSDIIDIEVDENYVAVANMEADVWINSGKMPQDIVRSLDN